MTGLLCLLQCHWGGGQEGGWQPLRAAGLEQWGLLGLLASDFADLRGTVSPRCYWQRRPH